MKHNYFAKAAVFCSIIAFPSFGAYAQCSAFIKKKCMPKIQPFTHNGQLNSTTLSSGQTTELNMTFYAGQAYRILVCSQEVLGDVTFKVTDMSKKVVFDSKDNNFPDFWDFKVKNTQQLIVHVDVPKSDSPSSILPSGCVSILVGFKKD